MKEPNFMCLGAPKCGTTTLYDILKQHDEVFLTSFKEPHFFDINKNYQEGYKWYINEYYNNVNQQTIKGEFTPSYFIVPKVPSRIYQNIGKDIKFILILRNPVDRAYSQYLHAKRDLLEKLSFEESLLKEEERLEKIINDKNDTSYIRLSYKTGGLYSQHLLEFLKYYDISQFKIFIFEEEFKTNREKVLYDICSFLNIKPKTIDVNIKSNAAADVRFPIIKKILQGNSKLKLLIKLIIPSKVLRSKIRNNLQGMSNKKSIKQELDTTIKEKLINKYFIDDIKILEKLINKDLSIWYKY